MNAPSVTVRVPATTANLGPGFDAVGMAVSLFANVTVACQVDDSRRQRPSPMRRMVTNAFRATYRRADHRLPKSLRIDVDSEIPLGRGLGASAAARAAGIVAANALMGGPLDASQQLLLGTELEGHADNIAPALFGGLQVVATDAEDGVTTSVSRVAVPLPDGIACAGYTPDFSMPTHETRHLLPKRLSRDDAVFNSSHAALLIAALSTGSWNALAAASQERLHQRPRSHLFPQMYDFFDSALAAGAYAAYLSGGGSTVMALTAPDRAETVRSALQESARASQISGTAFITTPCAAGATIQPNGETTAVDGGSP
jgi:homoserine kinase